MSETIHQEIQYDAEPATIYGVLTDSKRFGDMTGAPTEIDATDGGTFSCFGGMILGRNIECVPGERLVQAWRTKMWPPGVYSIVKFELEASDGGTKVVLDHSSFPEGQRGGLDEGWHSNYWEPLKKLLA